MHMKRFQSVLLSFIAGVTALNDEARHVWDHKPGSWGTREYNSHTDYLNRMVGRATAATASTAGTTAQLQFTPAMQQFQAFIENNPRIYMHFSLMFDEIPHTSRYNNDPTGKPQVRDYNQMLQMLNYIVTRGPSWNDSAEAVGLVGVPVTALFDYAMGTASGHAAFLDPDLQRMLSTVLNEWGSYLTSSASASVLGTGDDQWFGKHALPEIVRVANEPYNTTYNFGQLFVSNPNAQYYGFQSWDNYFTRQFRPGIRPVASPNDDNVIVNACESKVYNIEYNVQLRDRFFAKGQPYSLLHLLSDGNLAQQFVGGTVYQAFLSTLSYHRWHAPVAGVVQSVYTVPGTYFTEPLFEGVGDPTVHDINGGGIIDSQGYLSVLSARTIIVIKADNPAIGLMAFVAIGMDEVSTVAIAIQRGQRLAKGDEMGTFRIGGSTHCLLFRPGVVFDGFPKMGWEPNLPVRGRLATVRTAKPNKG